MIKNAKARLAPGDGFCIYCATCIFVENKARFLEMLHKKSIVRLMLIIFTNIGWLSLIKLTLLAIDAFKRAKNASKTAQISLFG